MTPLERVALRLVPLVLAALVFAPITANYFLADDFLHLYEMVNEPLPRFVVQPFAGHLYVVRNLVFVLLHHAFGTEPRWYFAAILFTHLVNVSLLFELLLVLRGSARLACAGATLWGTAPVLVGTLGWFSVYGHVLSATILLVLLLHAVRAAAEGRRVSAGMLVGWYALCLLGAASFGSGIGAALAFPIVVLLLLPAGRERTRAVAVLASLWVVVPALYALDHWIWARWYGGDPDALRFMSAQLGSLRAPAEMLLGLVAHGVTSLLLGMLSPIARASPPMAVLAVVLGLWASAVVTVAVRGPQRVRAQVLLGLVLAVATYAMTGLGRGNLAGLFAPGASAFSAAATARYHYVGPIGLTIATCIAASALATRWSVGVRTKRAALATLVGLVLLAHVRGAWRIDHWSDERRRTVETVEAIRTEIRGRPPGEAVFIPNRPFGVRGLPLPPGRFPGWAAVFAIFFPDDVVEGRRVRFVSSDPEVLRVTRSGRRSASLVVPAGESPGG